MRPNRKGIKERISLLAGILVFLLMLSATAATATGDITGTVFNDLDQDGFMDAGEPGLPGWTVTITGKYDSSFTDSATTGVSGYYIFPDLAQDGYFVAEIPQPETGWTETTPSDYRYGLNPEYPNSYYINAILFDPNAAVTAINFGNYLSGGGKMTGEGSVLASDGSRVKYEFKLNCDAAKKSKLEVNWGKGNKFHLEELTSAKCTDDPLIDQEKPSAGFDTYTGEGTGRYNKISSYTASWTFKDAGEPGINDWVSILIKDSGGVTVLEVSGTLKDGNIQAHKK